MMAIKLLLISNMYPSPRDKYYGIFIQNSANGLKSNGVNIKSSSLIKGRGKTFLHKVFKYFLFYISVVKNLLFSKYDVIYVHYPTYVGFLFWVFLPFISKPIVLNFHGSDILGRGRFSLFLLKMAEPVIMKAHCIVVPSEFLKNMVLKRYKLNSSKIFVSPSGGIDTNIFKQIKKRRNSNFFTLGFVGRIDDGKGIEVLLLAIADLKSKIPSLRCVIAGKGLKEAYYKNIAKELQVDSFTTFVGPLSHDALVAFYNDLDLFIFPTNLPESLGLVGIEALMCGVPVIGSKIAGLNSYIMDGVNGSQFEPGNHLDLVDKILMLYNNPNQLIRLKKEAVKSVKKYEKFTVADDLTKKLHELKCKHEKI